MTETFFIVVFKLFLSCHVLCPEWDSSSFKKVTSSRHDIVHKAFSNSQALDAFTHFTNPFMDATPQQIRTQLDNNILLE